MKIKMNMIEGNLFKKIIIFAIPIILSGLLQLFYNAADLIICDQFGTTASSTAAISATNSLINLIVNLFLGLSVGANVLMARCIGAKDEKNGQRVVYTSMLFSLFFGVVIGIFGFFFSKYFLKWMGTPDEVIDLSTEYLKIYFLGVPFTMIYNFGASLFRAKGDSLFPFLFLAFAGIFIDNNITQSISAKGSSVDNVPIESFFSCLKSGCIYRIDKLDKNDIEDEISKFIKYYNTERLQEKLKELTPIEYRSLALKTLF